MIRPKNSNGKGHWPAEESGEPEAKLGGAATANKNLKLIKIPKRFIAVICFCLEKQPKSKLEVRNQERIAEITLDLEPFVWLKKTILKRTILKKTPISVPGKSHSISNVKNRINNFVKQMGEIPY